MSVMITIPKPIRNIRTRVVLVTPDLAARYLKKNLNNRNLRTRYVERLANDMKLGQWKFTHQGIAFNCDGTLLDGQHRLHAVIKAGTAQWFLVTTGLPKDALLTIDDHARRSASDCLYLSDGARQDNMRHLMGTASAMMIGATGGHGVRSRSDLMNFFLAHEKAIKFARDCYPTHDRGLGRRAVGAAIARAFYTQDQKQLRRFCAVLLNGVPRKKNEESILKLRDWLLKSPAAGASTNLESYRKTARTILAYMRGEVLARVCEVSAEPFPLPEKGN